MGGALFSRPWRDLPEKNQASLEFIRNYKPRNSKVKYLRILLHGPVGAGKSSFINSVDSVLQGRITSRALTDAVSGTSFTQRNLAYTINKDEGSHYSFLLNDMMAYEQLSGHGVSVDDAKLVLSGHVMEGYKFIPDQPLTEGDSGYNPHPTPEDMAHVLVFVVPVAAVSSLSDGVVKKMSEVRLAANEMGIPQLAILTKVDEACSLAEKSSDNIYKSKRLREQVEKFHLLLGIPLNSIFLVKNYCTELDVDKSTNTAILSALKEMISTGEDFLNKQQKCMTRKWR